MTAEPVCLVSLSLGRLKYRGWAAIALLDTRLCYDALHLRIMSIETALHLTIGSSFLSTRPTSGLATKLVPDICLVGDMFRSQDKIRVVKQKKAERAKLRGLVSSHLHDDKVDAQFVQMLASWAWQDSACVRFVATLLARNLSGHDIRFHEFEVPLHKQRVIDALKNDEEAGCGFGCIILHRSLIVAREKTTKETSGYRSNIMVGVHSVNIFGFIR